MKSNIKIVIITAITTVITVWSLNHLVLLFVLFFAALYGAGIFYTNRLIYKYWHDTFPESKRDEFDSISILWPISFFIVLGETHKFLIEDINWLIAKLTGGGKIKFQWPVKIIKP